MEIATAKVGATTRTGLQHTHHTTYKHTHPSTQPLTWQHDIKSLGHTEQVDGSTVRQVHPGDIVVLDIHACAFACVHRCMHA